MAIGLFLYAAPQTLLTGDILDVTISREPHLIENVLMDGTVHMQTVGTAPRVATIIMCASDATAEMIDDYVSSATKLRVKWLTRYAAGYIRAVPKWSEVGFRYYKATVEMVVSSAGSQ